jgi:hypothetical protein
MPDPANGSRKGVETHVADLDEVVGGGIHRLLESRDPHPAASSTKGSVDTATSPPTDSSSIGSMAATSVVSNSVMRSDPPTMLRPSLPPGQP